MGGGDDHIGRQQGSATDEVVVAFIVPRVETHMPRHYGVVDRVAIRRELLHGRGNLAAHLLAAYTLATPLPAGLALNVGQRGLQGFEARGTHKLHHGARRMVAI